MTRRWAPLLALVVAACATPRLSVDEALAGVEADRAAVLAAADHGDEAELERRVARLKARRAEVLGPLAARGDAEALAQLASDLRDDDAATARWLALVTRAAGRGHPGAHDELTRWWWHQRGDGTLAAVQAARARALDHAEAAARGGEWHAVERIGVYIRGDVHQYPANPPLAARVRALAARAAPWAAAADEWRGLRAEILAHGETSTGVLGACTTSTPWCRR
jgi:hypothetical protein